MQTTLLILAPILAALAFAAWWIRRSVIAAVTKPRDDQALVLLQNQVNALNTQVAQALDNTRKSLDERLDNAARVIQGVSKQLGQLDESSRRIFDIGKDMASLQEVLRSPKLRGNISELFLEDLLAQILPPDHYRIQHGFRGGVTVDAAIVLKAGLVPVDAKFPLENFKLVVAAADDDARRTARKTFLRDVKIHVDAIASKYIRPDEGTFDFALMYIPAENVYYETIIKDADGSTDFSLFNYALSKRVIPVSPNSFYAYLQTILLGLKGLKVEESAREMLNALAGLRKDFERFEEPFRLIGKHLENSMKQFADADKRFGKLTGQMEQIEGATRSLNAPAAPPATPPARE